MSLNKLTFKDRPLFNKFLNLSRHALSVYAFENIYIWSGLFDIYYVLIKDALCVFFKDKIGCFLYLEPLAEAKNPEAADEAFKIMDKFNKNKDISRIENVEEPDITFYQRWGYKCSLKSVDYLYKKADLAQLRGNKFKSQRASFNYFTKHNQFKYLPFSPEYKNDCLKLHGIWKNQRRSKIKDKLYQAMLEESLICLKILLRDYGHLDFTGRLVRVNNEIRAFSFGFKLSADTFCILYEITDLSIKGLAQFIFRRFCLELKDYKYVNITDDSGLENLKRVKLSYHPLRLVPSYIVTRKDG